MSLIVLRAPASHSLHLPWVRATRPLVATLDLSELFALVPVRGPTADFLAPPPASPLPDFAEELQAVRATTPDRVAAELSEVPGLPEAAAERVRRDPEAAIGRLAGTLQAYWDIALAGHWPRIQALLEADVLWRSRRLAAGGAAALFEDLHATITWHGDRRGLGAGRVRAPRPRAPPPPAPGPGRPPPPRAPRLPRPESACLHRC